MQMKTHVLVAFLNSKVDKNILYRKKCLVCHCGGVWISGVLELGTTFGVCVAGGRCVEYNPAPGIYSEAGWKLPPISDSGVTGESPNSGQPQVYL